MLRFIIKLSIYPLMLTAIAITLAIFPVSAAAASSPESSFISDCPDIITGENPCRQVIQVINKELYKWNEYTGTGGTFYIYLLEPEEEPLSATRAEALLKLSRQWEHQVKLLSAHDSLDPAPEGVQFLQREGINDDRTVIERNMVTAYPYKTIGYLNAHFPEGNMRSTAFLVSPHLALTNAHNIYAPELGGWFEKIYFSPGQYETRFPSRKRPYSTLNPVEAEINRHYLDQESENNWDTAVKYDYAAIFFEEPFSGINTFMPLEFNHVPENIKVAGYPGFVSDTETYDMWGSEGKVISSDDYLLYYDAFTSGGNSGSPVIVYNSQAGTYRVVAIHTFTSPGMVNGGPHLNNKNKPVIERWLRMASDYVTCPVESISLNKDRLSLKEGEREALIASCTPQENQEIILTWKSSDPEIVQVDANGVIRALAPGEAIISVFPESRCVEASCTITVTGKNAQSPNSEGQQTEETQILPGDINDDGEVNVLDVVLLVHHILEINELEHEALSRSDMNKDGKINVLDATLLMRYALGIIEDF